jgi:hypothetical protein
MVFDFNSIFQQHATDVSHNQVQEAKVANMVSMVIKFVNNKMRVHQDYYNSNGQFGRTLNEMTFVVSPSWIDGLDRATYNTHYDKLLAAIQEKYGAKRVKEVRSGVYGNERGIEISTSRW